VFSSGRVVWCTKTVTWSRLASSKLLIFTLSSKTALFLLLPIFQLAWFLVKIYGIRARVGILLHLEILCGQAEGFEYHVAQILQAGHHLVLELLVALGDKGWQANRAQLIPTQKPPCSGVEAGLADPGADGPRTAYRWNTSSTCTASWRRTPPYQRAIVAFSWSRCVASLRS